MSNLTEKEMKELEYNEAYAEGYSEGYYMGAKVLREKILANEMKLIRQEAKDINKTFEKIKKL